jgi:hypothetical protein
MGFFGMQPEDVETARLAAQHLVGKSADFRLIVAKPATSAH